MTQYKGLHLIWDYNPTWQKWVEKKEPKIWIPVPKFTMVGQRLSSGASCWHFQSPFLGHQILKTRITSRISCLHTVLMKWGDIIIFIIACKYVHLSCKVGHYNMEVCGDWLTFEVSLKWPYEAMQFLQSVDRFVAGISTITSCSNTTSPLVYG